MLREKAYNFIENAVTKWREKNEKWNWQNGGRWSEDYLMQYFNEIFFLPACRYITTYVHKCTLKWFELYFDGHYLKRDRKGKKGFCVKLTLTMVFLVRLPRVFFCIPTSNHISALLRNFPIHNVVFLLFVCVFFSILFVFLQLFLNRDKHNSHMALLPFLSFHPSHAFPLYTEYISYLFYSFFSPIAHSH